MQCGPAKNCLVGAAVLGLILLLGAFFVPWSRVNWGKLELSPASTVTVTGQAKTQERSQIATFTAGVSSVNDDKETAVNEVNGKIETIISAVKDFGIDEKDIQTQNLSVYQTEERFYEEGVQKSRPGQWRVSNSIEIKLRDVDEASTLAGLLTNSGATSVHGPSFSLEETQEAEVGLLEEAIENAREKAETIAEGSNRTLGRIISVTEGTQAASVYRAVGLEAGGGAPIEPGTETVGKTVTVVFELK